MIIDPCIHRYEGFIYLARVPAAKIEMDCRHGHILFGEHVVVSSAGPTLVHSRVRAADEVKILRCGLEGDGQARAAEKQLGDSIVEKKRTLI
jgi:hypothetical protein